MHQRLETEDSLLEADGLAAFTARFRVGGSFPDGAGGQRGVYGDQGTVEGARDGCEGDTDQQPHWSSPARYDPCDFAAPSSPPPPVSASTRPGPSPLAPPGRSLYATLQTLPAAAQYAPPSRPPASLQGWSDPGPSRARPSLQREQPSSPHDWREGRSSRSTAYRYSPPFSPASEFPYSPPPPFASAEPQAVVSSFDDGDTDLCDSRGDLGTPGWSQSPADDERATDAASDKGLAYSSGALKGEWHAPAGAYLHGVGFDDAHAHGAVAGAQPGSKTSLAALERRRERLARKFGSSAASGLASERGRKSARTEEEELTGVDAYGRLVTQGRRKRVFLRCAQAGCALLVGVGAIGAAFTRPVSTPDHPVPAPKGSAPHWAIIIIPFLSLALTTYLFAARPCLYRRRREQQDAQGPYGGGGVGGSGRTALPGLFPLVQPALQGPPQRQGWFGGGSSPRPGPGGPHGGGMSVNLVVDPRFLPGFGGFDGVHAVAGDAQRREKDKAKRRRRRRRMREERRRAAAQRDSVEGADLVSTSSSSLSLSSLSSDDSDDPWTGSHPRSDGNPQGRTNPRRALFSHLAHESTWRAARSFAKRVAVADFACCVLWGAVGAWAIGWAGGCKPGEGEGFCDLFNTAEAFAIMSSVAFAASFTLGCFDLSRAKLSPRLRQQRLAGAV